MDNMNGCKRTHYCGDLRSSNIGETVTVAGFVAKQRDKGSLIFTDLRDRSGIVQMTFDENTPADIMEKAHSLRAEYVVMATAVVKQREAVNPDLPTGEIELAVSDLRLLSKAQTPPIPVSDKASVGDEARLTYRYLDLRRPKLQQNLKMRHDIARIAREYFYENDFYEIETPMLMKSTPEGARDYLVPSRVHPGSFYALPQSPQIYKQLLMIAGCDRYIQLARCFRDEDLRADRQPEFTQIDLEMSFVTEDDVMEMVEGFAARLMKELFGLTIPPIPKMTYADAMNRFGSDKPDTRFGMELVDVSDYAKNSSFPLFADTVANGGTVRAIVAKGGAAEYSRKKIDKLTEFVRGIGGKGLAYIRFQDAAPQCSFGKFVAGEELNALCEILGCEQGDVAFLMADKQSVVLPALGALRLQVAKQLDIIPENEYRFVWITEFPFFEKDEETGEYVAMHHPFTMPLDECLPYLHSDPERVRAKAYDLVLNGTELSSGSIRITDPDLQQQMFEALGMTDEEIEAKFGFLVEAYRYGAPPHGGAGIGLDRLAMILCGADSLRDVVAFPKVQNASELMSKSPSPVDPLQLEELHIATVEKENS